MYRFVPLVMLILASTSQAQDRRPSHCLAVADAIPQGAFVHNAAWNDTVTEDTVRLSYIEHASFLLQTSGGLNAVTDYTGFIGTTDMIPDVVTMNHAHDTHWTPFPDPDIPYVLNGWGLFGEGIAHNLELGEMLVRNVPTDIRSAFSGIEENGNSIFVFEVAGLCIGHLGHLHHIPNDEQFAAIGRLDVVMAPVDGGNTLPVAEMIKVLKRLRSSVVIPMHWYGGFTLRTFLAGMQDDFAIVVPGGSELNISVRNLPSLPTVMVLQPRFLSEQE